MAVSESGDWRGGRLACVRISGVGTLRWNFRTALNPLCTYIRMHRTAISQSLMVRLASFHCTSLDCAGLQSHIQELTWRKILHGLFLMQQTAFLHTEAVQVLSHFVCT